MTMTEEQRTAFNRMDALARTGIDSPMYRAAFAEWVETTQRRYLGEGVNEQGTPVSLFECVMCGKPYSVCPVVPAEKRAEWAGCQAEDCPSYEPMRDGDLYLGLGMVEEGRNDG
jgi:hypothetical protein